MPSSPFVGQIMMFAGNFAPRGWALCNGQLISIAQNDVLFALIGTIYGGDGQSTFALPDMRGRVPIHQGTGTGLSGYVIGQLGGAESVTLNTTQLPAHSHAITATPGASDGPATATDPAGRVFAIRNDGANAYADTATGVMGGSEALAAQGGGLAHDNMQPFLGVSFVIALEGIFPSRN